MKPQPHADSEDLGRRSRSMAAKLVVMVNGYANDRNRVRGLVLLKDRPTEKQNRPRSSVNSYDRPEVELIVDHADRAVRLEHVLQNAELAIESAKKQIDGGEPEYVMALASALGELVKVENQRMRHITAIEARLEALSKEGAAQEAIMARLAADAAQLSQKMVEHRDKMDLARTASDAPTDGELKKRLALRYNVPVDQVDAILSAKAIDAEAD